MLDLFKKNIMLIFTVILYWVSRMVFMMRVPSSPSPEQVSFFGKFDLLFALENPIPVLICIIAGFLATVEIYVLAKRYSKDNLLAFSIATLTSFSPWFFILTLHFNLYLLIFTLVVGIFLHPFGEKNRFRTAFLTATILPLLFGRVPLLHTFSTHDFFSDSMKIVDLRTLFFIGDWTSTFIRIPKTGYLMFIELLFLPIGLFTVLSGGLKEMRRLIILIFALGFGFFLAHIYNFLPSYRGIFIFLAYSFLSGIGFYQLIKNRRFIVKAAAILLLMINVFFYLELIYFHFDAWNSSDWTYAQSQIVRYSQSRDVKHIYLTNNSNDIHHFLAYYLPNVVIEQKPLQDLQGLCAEPPNDSLCIFTQEDLKIAGMNKDETFMQFTVVSGLPLYFAASY